MAMHLLDELKAAGLPLPEKEFMFAKSIGRQWRFDYAWPEQKLALEVEGGVWMEGRHVRGSGFIEDMNKYNCAAAMGWFVVRVIPAQMNDVAFRVVRAALTGVVTPATFPKLKKKSTKKKEGA